MANYYDTSQKWFHYLTRPFSLFETSLWQTWYESQYFERFFGRSAADVLCVEEARRQVRQYRTRQQLWQFAPKIFSLLLFQRRRFRSLLEEALVINQQAEKILHTGPAHFTRLEGAVDFLAKLVFYGAWLPYLPALLSRGKRIPKGKLGELMVRLRQNSYYPRFTQEIVVPLAIGRLKDAGAVGADELIDLVTIKELFSGDGNMQSIAEARAREVAAGNYFIYQQIGRTESVRWIHDPQEVLRQLEPKRFSKHVNFVKGQVAFRGFVRGVVAIVRDYDSFKDKFADGEVMVAPSTNPALLPLMKKATAIITDEGGITSHAAIVARELKIPCVIGTKIATQVFKDGDRVEVDAERGVVRKI